MAQISFHKVSYAYVVDPILDQVDFVLEPGEKVGLVGNNGSGKTTLFQLIKGNLSPNSGEINRMKDLKIGLLSQHMSFSGTVYDSCLEIFAPLFRLQETMHQMEAAMAHAQGDDLQDLMDRYANLQEKFLQMDGYSYESRIRGVLTGLGFNQDQWSMDSQDLSGGQRARLGLAQILLTPYDVHLFDEPTNHLDVKTIEFLEKAINDLQATVLVISHDRYFLDKVCKKIFHLENQQLKVYQGNYTHFQARHKLDLDLYRKQYQDQQKEIKRQEEIIKRFTNMGKARLIRQGQSRQKLLNKMKQMDAPLEAKKTILRFETKVQSGQDVLRVQDAQKSYDHPLFQGVNLNLYKGDSVGLIGDNGTGKSTLAKAILGKVPLTSGSIRLGSNVQLGYFDQELADLDLNKTVMDELWDQYPKLTHYEVRSYLAKFLFVGDDLFKTVEELSGGERGRLSLLKLMLSEANFLILDEPTNHLDMDSKEILEDALKLYEGSILTISHDRYFLNAVSNKIWALEDGQIHEFLGNYDYYLEKTKEEEDLAFDGGPSKTSRKKEQIRERQEQKNRKKEKEDLAKLEEKIDQLEKDLAQVDQDLADPDLYQDLDKTMALSKKRQDLEDLLAQAMDQWENFLSQ